MHDATTAPRGIRRVVAASLIGTTIEWYDFFLYGSAAALVFNKVFFPTADPLTGTLLAFLTYAVGFAARPLAAIGVAAPILLTVLRLVQGFALGGEWGGAVLIVSEHGDSKRRGFWASWPQAGAPGGNLLATAVLALLAWQQSDAAFLAWG